jgi:hypothetical protein
MSGDYLSLETDQTAAALLEWNRQAVIFFVSILFDDVSRPPCSNFGFTSLVDSAWNMARILLKVWELSKFKNS